MGVSAQQKVQDTSERNPAYSLARETALQGTVLSYTASSSVAPLGPRVVVQTASGDIDVHLGNAKLLEANHFSLSMGDSIRLLGESIPFGSGTQFVARVIQKGNQSLVLRSARGFPLRPMANGASETGKQQAGVL
jgi:hypothetical protein